MITGVRQDTVTRSKAYMVERLQLLDVPEVPAVKTMLLKMHTVSSNATYEGAIGGKVKLTENILETPNPRRKSRRLSHSPTDAEVPPPSENQTP